MRGFYIYIYTHIYRGRRGRESVKDRASLGWAMTRSGPLIWRKKREKILKGSAQFLCVFRCSLALGFIQNPFSRMGMFGILLFFIFFLHFSFSFFLFLISVLFFMRNISNTLLKTMSFSCFYC